MPKDLEENKRINISFDNERSGWKSMSHIRKFVFSPENILLKTSVYKNETSGWSSLAPFKKTEFDSSGNPIKYTEYENETSGFGAMTARSKTYYDSTGKVIAHAQYGNEGSGWACVQPMVKTYYDNSMNITYKSKFDNETSGWKSFAKKSRIDYNCSGEKIGHTEFSNETSGWKSLIPKRKRMYDKNRSLIGYVEYQNEVSTLNSMTHKTKTYMKTESIDIINKFPNEIRKTFLSNFLSVVQKEDVIDIIKANDCSEKSIFPQKILLCGLNRDEISIIIDAVKKDFSTKTAKEILSNELSLKQIEKLCKVLPEYGYLFDKKDYLKTATYEEVISLYKLFGYFSEKYPTKKQIQQCQKAASDNVVRLNKELCSAKDKFSQLSKSEFVPKFYLESLSKYIEKTTVEIIQNTDKFHVLSNVSKLIERNSLSFRKELTYGM